MERFTSSEFYPDTKKSGLVECIESNLPVFSIDSNMEGAKRFFACGYEQFVENYKQKVLSSPTPPNMYEVIQYDIPTKLYFDFDSKDMSIKSFNELIELFLKHCIECLSSKIGFNFNTKDIIILNSSTDFKCSNHVIFQYFFKDVTTVRSMVDYMVCTFNDIRIKDIVDFSVYSRTRSFRLIYSSKKGKTNAFYIKEKGLEYDQMDVFNSLIQAKPPNHYSGIFSHSVFFPNFKNVFEYQETVAKSSPNTLGTNINTSELPPRLEEYVKLVSDGGQIKSCKLVEDFIYCIVGNMKCPFKKREHNKNNQFFTFNKKSHMGWFKCSDSDCPQAIYKKDNLKWLNIDYC